MEMLGCRRVMRGRMVHSHVVERTMAGLLSMHERVVHELGARFQLAARQELVGRTEAVIRVVEEVDHARVVRAMRAHRVKYNLSLVRTAGSAVTRQLMAELHMRVQMVR